MKYITINFLLLLLTSNVMAKQAVNQDFHLTTYEGQQGLVSDIELFTKQPGREVFFGVTCSSMSPFPLIQVLLFNDEVVSETPRFLRVSYVMDGVQSESDPKLQGILKPVNTFEEYSNKIRLELEPDEIRSLTDMNQGYKTLLERFKLAEKVAITVKSGAIGSQAYEFSLKGFKTLIEPHELVCR